MPYPRNDQIDAGMLPVDIVLHPSWWFHHEGITFDEDCFFHPARRVEVERKMERALFERWGQFGLGRQHAEDRPVVGAVHLAAGWLISEMLGCRVEYLEDSPPRVVAANVDSLEVKPGAAFAGPAYRRFTNLADSLRTRFGHLEGDVNWGGVLNTALDLRGERFLMDLLESPDAAARFTSGIAEVIERFTSEMARATGTTSISVNRNVRHFAKPVFLHSECSHVMISTDLYERLLMPYDVAWSQRRRPFGIHYCGADPHRYAESFARLPHLDFLDVGAGGDVAVLRRHLPRTFLNLRYSPVDIVDQTPEAIRENVRRLVRASDNPWLTGVCVINMDHRVRDEQITAVFEEVRSLREAYVAAGE
ncbi:MAG: hypothetical protein NTW96_12255 [Planctomycetia bacterium]|nr:hypothetical protein [Planctomycetia bacterium]